MEGREGREGWGVAGGVGGGGRGGGRPEGWRGGLGEKVLGGHGMGGNGMGGNGMGGNGMPIPVGPLCAPTDPTWPSVSMSTQVDPAVTPP